MTLPFYLIFEMSFLFFFSRNKKLSSPTNLGEINDESNEKIEEDVVIFVLFEHGDQIILQDAGITQNSTNLTDFTVATEITNQVLYKATIS